MNLSQSQEKMIIREMKLDWKGTRMIYLSQSLREDNYRREEKR
jgi:hypothetical protein